MQNYKSNPFSEVLITLGLGFVIGFATLAFINGLAATELLHKHLNEGIPFHLLLIVPVLILIEWTKRNMLYFPLRAAHITDEKSSGYWTVYMSLFHFIGTLLGHISGVSTGRESAVVLFSAGLSRMFRLTWTFWGPIAGAIGFSSVVGQYWVAPVFMMELFGKTRFIQKVYSFMGAMLAVLIVKSFNQDSIISYEDIPTEMGFFKKLIFLFFFAACAGYLMRIYKFLYFKFSNYFNLRSLWVKAVFAMGLAVFLYLPEFRKFQGLGLLEISHGQLATGSVLDALSKLFFTLISTTLGFLGGEFIPLVYSGINFGWGFFNYFGYNVLMGSALGAYLLFAAATRFKWTGYILALSLLGSSWWFWAFFCVSIAVGFSGKTSIYRKESKN